MGVLGLAWAALKFMAPAFGTAFASAAGNELGTFVAQAFTPAANAAGVAPAIVERAGRKDLSPSDQQILQPVVVTALQQNTSVAASFSQQLTSALPGVANAARSVDEFLTSSPDVGQRFTSGVIAADDIDELLADYMGFTPEHSRYWIGNVCPVRGEYLIVVTYLDGLGRETSMTPGFPPDLMTMQGESFRT